MTAQMTPSEAGRAAADEVPRIPDEQAEAMARLLLAQPRRQASHEPQNAHEEGSGTAA